MVENDLAEVRQALLVVEELRQPEGNTPSWIPYFFTALLERAAAQRLAPLASYVGRALSSLVVLWKRWLVLVG